MIKEISCAPVEFSVPYPWILLLVIEISPCETLSIFMRFSSNIYFILLVFIIFLQYLFFSLYTYLFVWIFIFLYTYLFFSLNIYFIFLFLSYPMRELYMRSSKLYKYSSLFPQINLSQVLFWSAKETLGRVFSLLKKDNSLLENRSNF